jgi:hypothetical protein
MSENEFARLRAQIEREHEACVWALSGLTSGNAQHAFINARFRRMDACHTELSLLVGEVVATDVLCEIFDRKQDTFFGNSKAQMDQHQTPEPLVSREDDPCSPRDPSDQSGYIAPRLYRYSQPPCEEKNTLG